MKKQPLITALLLTAFQSVRATVLTFDTGLTDGATMPQTYGDNVTSLVSGSFSYGATGGFTPNVVVEYTSPGATPDLNFWTTGYSDLANVLENEPDGEASFTVRFIADPGFLVRLDSFDLGNFGQELTLAALRVEDGIGNTLFTLSNIAVLAFTSPHQDYDFLGGLTASEIRIVVDTSGLGGNSDNIGLDNIQFAQMVIPEPSATVLLLSGAALLLRRKRQQTGI
jgi:hypothetical protein